VILALSLAPLAMGRGWFPPVLHYGFADSYIAAGNDVNHDGWLVQETMPSLAVPGATERSAKHPIELVTLELRKVARLAGGAWNEFSESFLFIRPSMTDGLHMLLLLFAAGGFFLGVSDRGNRHGKLLGSFALVCAS